MSNILLQLKRTSARQRASREDFELAEFETITIKSLNKLIVLFSKRAVLQERREQKF